MEDHTPPTTEKPKSNFYTSHLRVYLSLLLLALVGLYCGYKLPISLFPNSSKPTISATIPYGGNTAEDFAKNYGYRIENKLRSLSNPSTKVKELVADYNTAGANYKVEFEWGVDPTFAQREVENVITNSTSFLSREIRNNTFVYARNENSGFLAISFYSSTRSMEELYDYLDPLLMPKLSRVEDAKDPSLWNPARKDIQIETEPSKLASFGLFPRDIEQAVQNALQGYGGGSVKVGSDTLQVQMQQNAIKPEDLNRILIPTSSGKSILLSEIAKIEYSAARSQTRVMKTSGAPSIILWAEPKPGANIKRMAEETLAIVKEIEPQLPKDIQYRVLVDPSEFIRASISNVGFEVALGALLAVTILFFFIGSFKNTVTAAIEIPLSMILAFILMRLSNMNLNLISLGGLALSAGMNVDASVVVLENIIRHFEEHSRKGEPLSFDQKVRLVMRAVSEVRFSVIASTIASVVVFLPLALTSNLTNAILGDLAKTVVFSHSFSAIVALILVPTVRLHLMRNPRENLEHRSPIEGFLSKLEKRYVSSLKKFISSKKLQNRFFLATALLLIFAVTFILPRLPKEIVGLPDTDWVFVSINSHSTKLIRQMESQVEETEAKIMKLLERETLYTFTQVVSENNGWIMARLRDKKKMKQVWKTLEDTFKSTPFTQYWVGPWNPAEMPIPNPPAMRISVLGPDLAQNTEIAKQAKDLLNEKNFYSRVWTEPNVERKEQVLLEAKTELWPELGKKGSTLQPSDLTDLLRLQSNSRSLGEMTYKGKAVNISLSFPEIEQTDLETISAFPIGVNFGNERKILPLKAFATLKTERFPPTLHRKNGRDVIEILTDIPESEKNLSTEKNKDSPKEKERKSKEALNAWWKEKKQNPAYSQVSLNFEESQKEITEALDELRISVLLSLLLIFLTLVLQFGDSAHALLVMLAIPLGFIGVLFSLWIFQSTLSLNSALGVILLNGLVVANSIILVDFMRRRVANGIPPKLAALEAAQKRLRPILITSLTSVLGMLPIAFGFGDGGRILQPLGITVSGGLWFSMLLTLFFIPALQVRYLEWKQKRLDSHANKDDGQWISGEELNSLKKLRYRMRHRFSGKKHREDHPGLHSPNEDDLNKPHPFHYHVFAFFLSGALLTSLFWPQTLKAQERTLGFDEAFSEIIRRSPEYAIQRETLDKTRAEALPSKLFFLPTLSADASRTWTGTPLPNQLPNPLINPNSRTEQLSVSSQLNLFKGGADYFLFRSALQAIHSQEEQTLATQLKIEKQALDTISDWLQRSSETQVYEKLWRTQNETFSIAKQRYDKGYLSLQELQILEIDLENALARLKDAEVKQVEAQALLSNRLGHTALIVAWPWTQEFLSKLKRETPLFEPNNIPSVRSAILKMEQENSRRNSMISGFLPKIDMDARYGLLRTTNVETRSWSASLSATFPLFDRLTNVSNYRAQIANLKIADAQVTLEQRDAKAQFEAAEKQWEVTLDTLKHRKKTFEMAQRLYALNIRRFKEGKSDANNLAIEQSRLANAELLWIDGQAQAHRSFLNLCHRTGKALVQCRDRPSQK